MKRTVTSTLAIVALAASALTLGQSGGEFEITKSTIDGGGGTSSGGEFSLTGTIGQHDAGTQILRGGEFSLAGGFWANAEVVTVIFQDGFESP